MRSALPLLLGLFGLAASSGGVGVASAVEGSSTPVPAGTRLSARMDTSIGTVAAIGPGRDADVTRAGEQYAASVTTPIFDVHGRERIPAGAILRGRVSALAAGVGAGRARIELTVDRLDGRPIRAHVVAAEIQRLPSHDAGKTADSTALAGIVIGGIAFGVPGVMIGYGGAAAPAAAGVVQQRRVEAWLSAGAMITVELDEPLA